jgi:4-nitrophenyl phosphatase
MTKKRYLGILADMDGTVNKGNLLIDGVQEVYKSLSEKGAAWLFLSNNAKAPAADLAGKLTGLGLHVTPDQVVNSASALIRTLKKDHLGARIMVVGEPKLIHAVQEAGSFIESDPMKTNIVVVALDTGLTYEKIKLAHIAISHGAQFWATNLDPTFPVPGGFHPGAGSVVASIATAVGRPPDRVFGKPATDMAILALEMLQLSKDSCLVVGDRMDTDVLFAKNAGMDSALVLTGATSRTDLAKYDYSPDYVFDSIADIEPLFD